MFRIGDIIGLPSKKIRGEWRIDCGLDRRSYILNVSISSSAEDGVRILLASGPEYSSDIAERVIDEALKFHEKFRLGGTLIALHDFASFISDLKKPGEPLFPGWPDGDDGEVVAYVLFNELISQVDYAIFLEGPEAGFTSLPHGSIFSIDDPPTISCHPEILKMMGHDLICEKKGMKGSLAIEAQREFALPVLITQIDDTDKSADNLDWAKEKVLNFLSFAGLIPPCITIPTRTFIASRSGEVRSDYDGEFNLNFQLNDFLSSGEKIGTILNQKTTTKIELENDGDGYVVRKRDAGHVLVDDLLYSLLEVHFRDSAPSKIFCDTMIDNKDTQGVNLRDNTLFTRL